MILLRIAVPVLTGAVVVYVLVETFVGIEPKQYHIESGNYPPPLAGQLIPVSAVGTATIYQGTNPYYTSISLGTIS